MINLREVLIAGFLAKGKSEVWAEAYARAYLHADIYAKEYADDYEQAYLESIRESKLSYIRAKIKHDNMTAEEVMNALKFSPEEQKELAPLI